MINNINDFLDSEVRTISSRNKYLDFAKNVQAGNNAELSLTGDAFDVSMSQAGVVIESLWDDDFETIQISLEEFILLLSHLQ